MFKKIMKQIKRMTQDSSKRRYNHYRRGSSSDRRYKRSPLSGSNYYKRKGRSSS